MKNINIIAHLKIKYNKINKKIIMQKISVIAWKIFRGLFLFGMCYVLLYPIIYMLSTAFRPVEQSYDPAVIWIPKSFTLSNMHEAFKALNYPKTFLSTVQVGLVSALLQIISCTLVGYGFARFKFKLRNLLFGLVIFTLVVPMQTLTVPMYIHMRNFDFFGLADIYEMITGKTGTVNLLDSLWAFYLPSIFGMGLKSGLYIFVMREFFRGIPKELEQAALIDGCGYFRTFLKVMLPNAAPALLTIFLFSVVWQWNDYYTPAMFFANNATLATAMAGFRQRLYPVVGNIDIWDPYIVTTRFQAGCLLVISPLIITYIFTQKYFTESISRTGIVG